MGSAEHSGEHEPDSPEPDDLLYEAWGIIANAHEGNWFNASDEWRHAAERWRDRWHDYIGRNDPSDET